GRDRSAEDRVARAVDFGGGVSVCERKGQTLPRKAGLLLEPAHDLVNHRFTYPQVVEGDNDVWGPVARRNRHRLRPNPLSDSLRLLATKAKAIESHRVIGGDVDLGDADRVLSFARTRGG